MFSNIWSSYIKSSMELRLFEYFYASTENIEIKQVVEKMLNQSQSFFPFCINYFEILHPTFHKILRNKLRM
jgi:hypothetical protein